MNSLEILDERILIFSKGGWRCAVCGGSVYAHGTPQLAHRIANTKSNRKKYGAEVIDDPSNRVPVCSLKCNDACNLAFKPVEANKLAEEINGRHE